MNTFMDIYGHIVLCIMAVIYVASLIYVIHDIILILIPAIKCRKVTGCKKDDCPFREGCCHISYSDKEKAEIRSRIDSLK